MSYKWRLNKAFRHVGMKVNLLNKKINSIRIITRLFSGTLYVWKPLHLRFVIPVVYSKSHFVVLSFDPVPLCGWSSCHCSWRDLGGDSSFVGSATVSFPPTNPLSFARSDCRSFVFVDVTSIFQRWRTRKQMSSTVNWSVRNSG